MFVVAIFALSAVPVPFTDNRPTDAQLIEFYVTRRGETLVVALINTFTLLGVVAFIHGLSDAQRRAGSDRFADLTWRLGLVGLSLTLLYGTVQILPAFRLAEVDIGLARTLWDISLLIDAISFVVLAAFFGIASLGALVTRTLPRLVSYLGLLLAPAALGTGLIVLFDFSSFVGAAARGVAFLGFVVWMATVSGIFLRRYLRSRSAAVSV